jgi:hypothetical protein
LACIAATFNLKLPKLTGTLSPAFVFVLVAVATCGWAETVAIAALSGIVQCLWRPKRKPTFLQVAFNAAAMAVAGGVSHGMAAMLLLAGGPEVLVVVLGAAGITLLVCNTLLLATILCLIQEAPFMTVWRSVHLWAVPYYLAGGVLANIWARANLSTSMGYTILATASVYALSLCYRELSRLLSQMTEVQGTL